MNGGQLLGLLFLLLGIVGLLAAAWWGRDPVTESLAPPSVCPECVAGKHGNCNSDAWDDDRDCPTACDCWENDHHGAHWPPCPWCSDPIPVGEMDTHLAADHGTLTRPTVRTLLRTFDPEGDEADRESDRLDRINEGRLP